MQRDLAKLKLLIETHGLNPVMTEVLQYARRSIRLETTPAANEADLAIGQSKLGGRPDLPHGWDWPRQGADDGDAPLPFIAQIDLTVACLYDEEALLPARGMLYFFGYGWGAYRERAKVLHYTGDPAALIRTPFPADLLAVEHARYHPCAVTFIPEVNLDALVLDFALPDGKTWHDVHALRTAARYTEPSPPFSSTVTRLLGAGGGFRDLVTDCQQIAEIGHPDLATSAQRNTARAHEQDWQSLLQVGSDENAKMMWGDAGTLYFYIRDAHLAASNFDEVCLARFSP